MQRKEQLLSQLDVALRRKVQEKYMKQTKSQDMDPLAQEFYGGETDRNKYSSKVQQKVNSNTNTNMNKSPHVASQKQAVNHAKSQNNIHSKVALSPHQLKSPKLQTERDIDHEPTSSIHLGGNVEEQYARVKARNNLLQKEMRELKMNITQLQTSSKLLKREQGEYLKLKQENLTLGKEIQFLRAKNSSKKEGDLNIAVVQQEIKRIMLQLNLSFINKHTTSERFINEALKGVSQGVSKLIEDKNKLASKLNNFDIENVLNKESNAAYRKEIDILRVENQQLNELIEDNCSKIEQLQRDLQTESSEKKKLQFHYKEVCKQLDSMKRQFKLTVEASKHSKPKREYSAVRSKQPLLTEQSIARTYSEQEIQTENEITQPLFHELVSDHEQDFIEEKNDLLNKINELTQHINQLESNSLKNSIQKSKLQEKIYKYEQYIKELQYKSQEIQKDLNNFMPQLQQIQEENRQLRQANSIKDQEIINKLTTINEIRNNQEQLEEKLSINEMQFKKQVFEHELTKKELERMRSNLNFLTQKERILENEVRNKQTQLDQYISMQNSKQTSRQCQLATRLRESQLIVNQKKNQISAMVEEWSNKQKQYQQQIAKLKEKSIVNNTSKQQLNKFTEEFSTLRQNISQRIANHNQNKEKTKKLLIQYGVKFQQTQNNLDKLDQTNDNIWQQYTKLQKSYNSLRQQKEKIELSYQNQALKNDQLVREIFSYKCDIQRLSFDSKNNGQLKDYFQQTTNEMKSKLEQLLIQNGKLEKEKTELIEKNNSLENFKKEIEVKHAQVAHNWQQSGQQCEDLKRELYRLSNGYHLLSQDYIAFKDQAQNNQRQRLQQISLQVFDMERLIKQSNEMKARIEQLTSLKESKVFRETEADQKIILLTEENRSLAKRYEMLQEQLRMKQANKEEDQYLNQLKNKQYCILLKKLITDLMDQEELDHYSSFQQLLEIASDRAVKRKKQIRDHESQMRKTLKNQYEIEYTKEYPAKRYYIGTEISSSQQIMGVRNFGEDEIIQLQSKIIDRPIARDQESPRSFKFSFSPYQQQKKEKRTERLISCYNTTTEGQSKLCDNRETFKH